MNARLIVIAAVVFSACVAEVGDLPDASTGGGVGATGGGTASGGGAGTTGGGTASTGGGDGTTGGGSAATGGGDGTTGGGTASTGGGTASTGGGSATTGGGTATGLTTAKIMWSGHSLTDNPLPDDVEAIALSLGLGAQWQQQNVIGSPIRVRTVGNGNVQTYPWTGYSQGKNRTGNGMNLVTELRNPTGGAYTTLVIAENHNALDMLRWENTVPLLRHYYELFREGSPSGRGYFYGTWKDVFDKSSPTAWITHEREQLQLWESVTSRINESLAREGRSDRIATLPASGALAELIHRATTSNVAGITQNTNTATLNVIFSDDVHLTRTGVYFMACVVFSSVYGRSPVGATPPTGVNATAATSLQNLAWTYVSTYYANNPLGPQHDNATRLSSVHAFINTYFTYRNQPNDITGYRNHFSAMSLSNPLWTSSTVNESSFWLPQLP